MDEQKLILEALKNLKESMLEKSKPKNPYLGLGNLKQDGYDLNSFIEQKFLFNQYGPYNLEVGFIPEGILAMLVSPGGCGKTYALMQCAIAAATETKWFEKFRPTKKFKTLFIAAEDDRSFAHNRMRHIINGLGFIKDNNLLQHIYENIHMLPLCGQMQRLTDAKGEITDNYKNLKDYLESNHDIKMVILDPASRFLGPQCELDNSAATDWVAAVSALTQIKSKPTIIISHHANKTAIRPINGAKDAIFDQSITRGASALVDGARLVLGMQRKEENNTLSVLFKIFKTNVCDIGDAVELTIDRSNGGILTYKTPSSNSNNPRNSTSINSTAYDKTLLRAGQ